MMFTFRVVTCLLLSLFAHTSLALGQSTVLVFQSEPGDYIGQGATATYTPANAPVFRVSRDTRQGITAEIRDANYSFWWSLHFAAPEGTPLTTGYYPGANRYPFAAMAAMDMSGTGRGCNTLTGRFMVRELVYGAGGEVLKAAIDAEQHCEDATPALFAALRYNSTVPTDLFPNDVGKYAIRIQPSAYGTVVGDAINCGPGLSACSAVFGSATTAALTAVPNPGYIFMGWTGGCSGGLTTTVNVNMQRDCEATFDTEIPLAPRTRLTLTSTAGDYILQGRHEVYSLRNSLWKVQPYGSTALALYVDANGRRYDSNWHVIIDPLGVPVIGQWIEARRFPQGAYAGIDFAGEGRGCNQIYGRIRVHEWRRDPSTGAFLGLAVDFEQRCESPTAPLLSGTIHYRATFEMPAPPPVPTPSCATPDPFVAIGGGTCYNGGWLPPGMTPPSPAPAPSTPPPTVPPPTSGCTTPDPFAGMGGGTCYNGGWLPPGMTPPGGATPPPPAPTPTPVPTPTPTSCATPDPFAAIGGGTCFEGGWLPPGMTPPGGSPMPPPPPPTPTTPPVLPGSCATPDPFAAIGGGTCYAGGWLPPGMAIPGGGGL